MNQILINNSMSSQKIPDIFISIEDKILSQIKKNIPFLKSVFQQMMYFLFLKEVNNRTLYLLFRLISFL